MNGRYIAILLFLILLSSGCGKIFAPTYTKDNIPSSIQKLCREEYGIGEKVDVKISGKTVGVRLHLDELLDINLKLQEKALDKLQKLLRIIRRICLSTDADLAFFVIIGYEKKLGIEVMFYSYIDDLKRVSADWMSPDDYFQRLIRNMQMDTLKWGNNRIDKFLNDMESGNMLKVITNDFSKNVKFSELNTEFLRILTDMNKKSLIKWSLVKSNSIPVGSQERLYYIEAKEYYTPAPNLNHELQYPSGTIHKFYILITIDDLNALIKNIYTPQTLPKVYAELGEPSKWNANEFFVEDITFQEFLSFQIVQRIQTELSEEKKEDNEISFSLKGDFIVKDRIDTQVKLADPSENIFKITISPRKQKKPEIPQKIIDIVLNTIKDVCNKYKFYDMGEIRLEDNKGNPLLTIDKPTLFGKH